MGVLGAKEGGEGMEGRGWAGAEGEELEETSAKEDGAEWHSRMEEVGLFLM